MRLPAVAAATALVLTMGCGGGWLRDPESSSSTGDELRRQNLELRREKTVAEVELARLRQEVARLEAELAALREQLSRAPATRGEARRGGELAAPAAPAVEEEELDDDELAAPAPQPAARPSPPSREVDDAARNLYDESYALFHEQRYRESEQGFERFLELYPRTDLADNAQYWIGECRFARGEIERALEAFMRTVELYPEGNKVPDALLKAGRCLERMGDGQAAKATYEEIVRRFGASAAATSARQRLAELR